MPIDSDMSTPTGSSVNSQNSQRNDRVPTSQSIPSSVTTNYAQQNGTNRSGPSRILPSTTGMKNTDIRHQQQRLLLLRHAAKCETEGARCPVTPHCAAMKKLWTHIMVCKQDKCPTPLCTSSRYILSHFHRCKDLGCMVCIPVNDAVRASKAAKQEFMNMRAQSEQVQDNAQHNPREQMAKRIKDIATNQLQENGLTPTGRINSEAQRIAEEIEVILWQEHHSESAYAEISDTDIQAAVAGKLSVKIRALSEALSQLTLKRP